MSDKIEKLYNIGKELADKIDKEYDELFGANNVKLGFGKSNETNWPLIDGSLTAKCGYTDLPSQLHKEIWNRAIEKAASVAEINSAADIRKLKV